MHKFDLDTPRSTTAGQRELEIARDEATALGIAGKSLERSLTRYHSELRDDAPADRREPLIEEIAASISALIVQRELAGLTHETLEWVLHTYDIPEAALTKLGLAARAGRARR